MPAASQAEAPVFPDCAENERAILSTTRVWLYTAAQSDCIVTSGVFSRLGLKCCGRKSISLPLPGPLSLSSAAIRLYTPLSLPPSNPRCYFRTLLYIAINRPGYFAGILSPSGTLSRLCNSSSTPILARCFNSGSHRIFSSTAFS